MKPYTDSKPYTKGVYYEIQRIYSGSPTCVEFIAAVDKEWIAKDICKRYDHLTYEKREVIIESDDYSGDDLEAKLRR